MEQERIASLSQDDRDKNVAPTTEGSMIRRTWKDVFQGQRWYLRSHECIRIDRIDWVFANDPMWCCDESRTTVYATLLMSHYNNVDEPTQLSMYSLLTTYWLPKQGG